MYMKKIFIGIIALLVATVTTNAQDLAFGNKSNRVGIGLGLPNVSIGSIKVPALSVAYEHGIVSFGKSTIGVGGAFEFSSTADNKSTSGELFGKYHYNFTSRFDLSGRIGFGYGGYGSVKSVFYAIGADVNFQIINGFGVFAGLEAGSLPGKAFMRGGIFFQF